ncbi:hypothetical protein PUN4_1060014 [Paraburkholderia unamae]|nr:hypothetical protein PUN4_1060014 [Paraburkholderia unamae]
MQTDSQESRRFTGGFFASGGDCIAVQEESVANAAKAHMKGLPAWCSVALQPVVRCAYALYSADA